jgi:NAD(P)-dependent dehydrogenase (short-subunit alcohol dehydrogenase family)
MPRLWWRTPSTRTADPTSPTTTPASSRRGPDTADVVPDEWARVLAVNLTGVWHCMRARIPAMLARGGGSIINTSSGLGLAAIGRQSAYIAAKHGVVGLTRASAIEYSARGVRVNCICPGVVMTAMLKESAAADPPLEAAVRAAHPIGRLGTTEEIAASVVWLASDASSFVTGVALRVDGGYTAH